MGSFFSAVLQYFAMLWHDFLAALLSIIQWLLDLVQAVANLVLDLVAILIKLALAVLPVVPEVPHNAGSLGAVMAQANYFVPLDLIVTLLPIMATVYGSIWLYKLGKFLRGGG